jgi:hypothetical protein
VNKKNAEKDKKENYFTKLAVECKMSAARVGKQNLITE